MVALFVAVTLTSSLPDTLPWQEWEMAGMKAYCTPADSTYIEGISQNLRRGRKAVTTFFGREFPSSFAVFVFPSRNDLDRQWEKAWQAPGFKSECWMVASGVAGRLDLLSPRAWKKESCDHNPDDSIAKQRIITHELVHIFHGQHNPNPNFDGMDELAWLIEGLATYASGQLTAEKLQSVSEKLKSGEVPPALADLWKGNTRYQQAGSLVRYIDQKFGRKKLISLLEVTDTKAALKALKLTERKLLEKWKEAMTEEAR